MVALDVEPVGPLQSVCIGTVARGAAHVSPRQHVNNIAKGPKETSRISGQFSHFPQTRKVPNSING